MIDFLCFTQLLLIFTGSLMIYLGKLNLTKYSIEEKIISYAMILNGLIMVVISIIFAIGRCLL